MIEICGQSDKSNSKLKFWCEIEKKNRVATNIKMTLSPHFQAVVQPTTI